MRFKVSYEARHGYDSLHGAESGQIAGEEIQRILCDLLSFRGNRMLDLCRGEHALVIHLRFWADGTRSAAEIYENCARDSGAPHYRWRFWLDFFRGLRFRCYFTRLPAIYTA